MPSCFKSVHITLEPKQNYMNMIFSVYLANSYYQFLFYCVYVSVCAYMHMCGYAWRPEEGIKSHGRRL